jgi:dipeptidyl aminopeptidase/acylaminoacyl peptidase
MMGNWLLLRRSVKFVGAGILGISLVCAGSAQDTHPFSVHDMLAMDRISDHQVSPDGSTVVFVVRKTDLEHNRGTTDLWIIGADGRDLRQLTTSEAADASPRWDPSGESIWFLSSRSGSMQVWKIDLKGGEAQQVTRLPLDVDNLAVSPDGSRLVISMEVFAECASLECTTGRLKEHSDERATGQAYDQLFVRHWDTWEDGRRSHLFSVSREGENPVDLMPGLHADCPSKPFGGMEEVAISPDSGKVVFTAKDVGRTEAWSTNFDLFSVPLDGSAKPECITGGNKAWDTNPVFSPDGKWLAYLAMSRPGFEADRYRIMLRSLGDGTEREVAPNWDRSPGSLAWTPDSRNLIVTADNLGQTSLFSVDVATAAVRTLHEKGTVGSPVVTSGRVVFALDHLQSPAELFSVALDGTDLQQISKINGEKLARVRMGEPEQFAVEGWNGEQVYVYIVKPVDLDPGRTYPVAFLIHGGPQGSFGNHFHYRWNPQAYSGAGYAAVMVDFHGSTGYGQAFTDSISRDWGVKPLVDLQKGLAATLNKYPWMDGDRVGALGASYGGFMINWIAGKWNDRFRCLVNHDGVFDMRSMFFTSEELWFPEWEQGGTYWGNPEGHEEFNPALHVSSWKTPMLVVQGALDYRVPLEQGIGAFTALQRQGIPSRFLYFPDENHWVLKPANSIQWHEEVLAWLAKYLK